MKTIQGLENLEPLPESVLTVGNFDGVHRAHQQLLAQAGLFAANTGGPVVVLTFEPHPLTIVAPDRAPQRLTLPEEKLRLLEDYGVDVAVVARSDPELLGMEPEAFVREILWEKFRPTHIVEGPSFGFGRRRRGTPELLAEVAGEFGCEVHILGPVTVKLGEDETVAVSSSLVRKLLSEGRVRRAALCLGCRYVLQGPVVSGGSRGKEIGFPTANIDVEHQLVPADGVYAGRASVDGREHLCGISIGHTPTFGGRKRQIEAHLLDFDEDIYGRTIGLSFERFIRGQRKFDSPQALSEQLQQDVAEVRRLGSDGHGA